MELVSCGEYTSYAQEAAGGESGSRAEHGVYTEERMSLGLNKSEVPNKPLLFP